VLAIVNTPNGPEPVAIRETAEPEPAPNEAIVAVQAFSLNRGELRLFQIRPEGWCPGQDIAGVVVKAAADGSGLPAGTRIVALTDQAGWAQHAAVPSHRMTALPDNISFAAAASLPVAGLTALRTVRHGAPLLGKRVELIALQADAEPAELTERKLTLDELLARRIDAPAGAAPLTDDDIQRAIVTGALDGNL